MPQEVLEKLEILEEEQKKGDFKDLEQIVEESIHLVESLTPSHTTLKRRHLKDYLWWETNYRIFLAQRKAQRARRKSNKKKS